MLIIYLCIVHRNRCRNELPLVYLFFSLMRWLKSYGGVWMVNRYANLHKAHRCIRMSLSPFVFNFRIVNNSHKFFSTCETYYTDKKILYTFQEFFYNHKIINKYLIVLQSLLYQNLFLGSFISTSLIIFIYIET